MDECARHALQRIWQSTKPAWIQSTDALHHGKHVVSHPALPRMQFKYSGCNFNSDSL